MSSILIMVYHKFAQLNITISQIVYDTMLLICQLQGQQDKFDSHSSFVFYSPFPLRCIYHYILQNKQLKS
jgi:hypothetical protein